MLAFVMAFIQVRSVQREIDLAANNLATNSMVAVDQFLNAHIAGLQALAASPLTDNNARWSDLYNQAQGYQQSFGTHVIFADREQQMLFNTRVPLGAALPRLPHIEGHAAIPVVLSTGKPDVGDRFRGPVANQSLVALAVPVIRNKKIDYVFLTTIETGSLQTQLGKMAIPPNWSIALVDSKGETIASSGAAGRATDNAAVLQFKASSGASPWQTVIQIPKIVYWGPVISATITFVIAICLAVFLGMIAGRITGKRLAFAVASLTETNPPNLIDSDIAEIAAVRQRLEQAAQYRTRAESALDNFKTIVESTEEAIISKTLDGVITSWNHGAEIMFGYTASEAIGSKIDMLIPADRLQEEAAILEHIAKGEGLSRFETVRRRKDGRIIQVATSISPILDSEEHPVGASKIVRDITEQKMAQEQIRAGEAMLEAALASMSDAVFISDSDGKFIHFNDAFATFHGFENKDQCARTLAEFSVFLDVYSDSGELLPLEQWAVPRALRGQSAVNAEYTLHRKDTGARWIGSYNFAPIRNNDGQIVGTVVSARDITEMKKIDTLLRESELTYRSLFENMLNGFAYCQIVQEEGKPTDFIYLKVNEAFGTLTGLKEVVGKKVSAVIPGIHDTDLHLLEIYERVARTGQSERFEIYIEALQMWYLISVYGTKPGYFVTIFDVITARKNAEQALIQSEMRLSQLNIELEQRVTERTAELTRSNQELDSFAYAVSHDLRGPLRSMSGFSQALVEDYGSQLNDEAKSYLGQIDLASHKMSALIDGILFLSRITRGDLKCNRIDLSALATALLTDLEKNEPDRKVAWQVEPGLAAVGDAGMIEAALGNLLGNAWKYTGKAAAPAIRVAACTVDGQPGFCIADNGAGFDMAHIERMFKPFQRLHRQDEFPGLGIGLATVQRIIKRHGGTIHAHGHPGQGATFSFTLPVKNQMDQA